MSSHISGQNSGVVALPQHSHMLKDMSHELLDYVLKAGKPFGITDAHVSVGIGEMSRIRVESQDVTSLHNGREFAAQITCFANDKVQVLDSGIQDLATLKAMIDAQLPLLHDAPENPFMKLIGSEEIYRGPTIDLDQRETLVTSLEDMIEYAKVMERVVKDYSWVSMVSGSKVIRELACSHVCATNGLDMPEASSEYYAVVQPVAITSSEKQQGYGNSQAAHFEDLLPPYIVGHEAAAYLFNLLNATQPESGVKPVILDPDSSVELFDTFFSAIDAEAHRNKGIFSGKVGQLILPEHVMIDDLPHIKRSQFSVSVDMLGMLQKPLRFVDRGVLTQYFCTLEESRRQGLPFSGRGNGLTNVVVTGGTRSEEEMISTIKDGLYITGFNGGTVSVLNGTFSCPAQGLHIKDGKKAGPASNFIVAGQLRDMFAGLELAHHVPKVPNFRSNIIAPAVLLQGCTISV